MKMKNAARKAGQYSLKALYPLLGALPERTQDWLEEKFESYDKFAATEMSGAIEGCAYPIGLVAAIALPPLSLLYAMLYGSVITAAALDGTFRSVMASSECKRREVFGSAFLAIPAKPVYWTYDKLAEKFGNRGDGE